MLDEIANDQATEAQEDRRVEDDESEMRDALLIFKSSEVGADFDWTWFRIRDLFTGPSAPWGAFAGKGYAMNTAAAVLSSLGFERKRTGKERAWSDVTALKEKRRHEYVIGVTKSHQEELDFM